MIDFLKTVELDNLLALSIIGVIAIVSLTTTVPAANVTLATSVVSGMVGYLSKGVTKK